MTLEWLLQWVGGIGLALVTSTGLAYALFKHFAQSWLDSRFAQRLEVLRHDQARDLEAMRYQISGLVDRTARLNDAEFRVLPEAWTCLKTAYYQALGHTGSLKQYPDLDRMDGLQLEEFLKNSPLTETQRQELRAATDKVRTYAQLIYWHEKGDAEKAARKLARFIEFNGLFLREKADFKNLSDMIWEALTEHKINEEHDVRPRVRLKVVALEKEGGERMEKLEEALRTRIWTVELPKSDRDK